MSSRILRGKPVEESRPVRWRPVDQPGSGFEAGGQPAADAGAPHGARASPADWEAQVRAAFEQGFREGRSAAQEAARAHAEESVRPAIEAFRALIGDLAHSRARLRNDAEEDAVRLALAIAQRILHRELTTDPEAILGLTRAAWGRVDARETHRLRLSADDAAIVQAHREELNLPSRVEVTADPSLPRGSAVFETSRGSLDASIPTQLAEIERGLTDVLKRHSARAR